MSCRRPRSSPGGTWAPIATGLPKPASAGARRCSGPAAARASRSCWPSCRRPSAIGSWTIRAGCVAGVAASWKGLVGDKTVVDLNVRWRKGQTLDPDWKIEQDGWVIQVEGMPTVTLNVGFLPPPDFQAETIADFMVIGHIITAMPAINAAPAVVAATPGIVTYNDLPLVLPRGNMPSG